MEQRERTVIRRKLVCGAAARAVAALGIAAGAHAAGDETIKVALIGCGFRGTGAAAQSLLTKGPVKLWAMADLFADRLESCLANLTKGHEARYDREAHQGFAGQIDVPPERRFLGFDAYKKAMDSGVDVVILATHGHFRPAHYEYAVKQGKHVFMEKPVAVDAPGIRQVLAADEEAKKKGLKVAVGLQRRHNLRQQETIKRVKDGAIGEIAFMRCYCALGDFRGYPRPDMTEMEYQLRSGDIFAWLDGGYLVCGLIHPLDMCNWAKGAHPVTAQGQGGRQVHTGREYGDTHDHAFVEFTYEDGTKMFGQCRSISGCWNSHSAHVHGTKGTADIDGGRIEGSSPWRFRGSIPNPYQVEHDVLVDAIRNNKPHNEAEYGAISTMATIMGRMASDSGQMITWDQAINSKLRLGPNKYAFDAAPPVVPDKSGSYPVATPGVAKVL